MQRLQFAPPIILDEMAVISLETPEKSPDLNVRFCLPLEEPDRDPRVIIDRGWQRLRHPR